MTMDKVARTGLCGPIRLSMHDTPSREYLLLTSITIWCASIFEYPWRVVNIFTCAFYYPCIARVLEQKSRVLFRSA